MLRDNRTLQGSISRPFSPRITLSPTPISVILVSTFRGRNVMRDFIHRANIDHYLELLNDPGLTAEKGATIVKLLVAEEDKLSHNQAA